MTKKKKLRIASYNINGITSRLEILLRWLDAFQPDIVGLQELKTTDDRFPAEAIEAAGYQAIWHGYHDEWPVSWPGSITSVSSRSTRVSVWTIASAVSPSFASSTV